MTLSLIFALDAESAPWRARHPFRRVVENGHAVYDAQIGGSQVRVAMCGVRAPRIRELAPVAFAGPPDAVVAVGLSGALGRQYRVGDVIAPRSVRAGTSASVVSSDERLMSLVSGCGAVVVDSLLSVDQVIGSASDKRRLAETGDIVDMESFAVLSEAGRRGIAGVAVRVIGDSADEDLPLDFTRALRPDGTFGVLRLLRETARRPHRWPSLVAFAVRQRRSLNVLADFLDRFVGAIK